MPNIKSAKKRVKTSEKRRVRNRAVKSAITTAKRRILDVAAGADKVKCKTTFSEYCSTLDKAVKKGIIARNNASRRKSRAAARLAALQ